MRSDFRAGERKMVKRKTPNFFRNQAFLAEDEGFDCQFANGKLYGDDQFLNWSLPQSTGLWHLNGFEPSKSDGKKKTPPLGGVLLLCLGNSLDAHPRRHPSSHEEENFSKIICKF